MNDPERDERIRYMTEQYQILEETRHEFAIKHGFAYTRPHNFRHCLIIKWGWIDKNHKINYPKLEEYVQISHTLSDDYDLWDKKHPLLDSELKMIKAGLYSFQSGNHRYWAIPNENKDLQKYILNKLPKWAIVIEKTDGKRKKKD